MEKEGQRVGRLRDMIEQELTTWEDVKLNGSTSRRLPPMTNISFDHIDESRLIPSLKQLAVSRGSACSSTIIKPSHVLKSLGLTDQLALSSLRIGLGRFTTEEEVLIAIDSIKATVEQLRLTAI